VVFDPVANVFEPAEKLVDAEPAASSAEVLTETMAELYRSQGLYDRAAEVYRALLMERPGDGHLRAMLQEVESAMAPSAAGINVAPEAPPFEITPEPEFEPPPPFIPTAPEGLLEPEREAAASPSEDDVPSPWTGFNQAATSAPSLYAWKEDARSESESGPPVSEYFRALLSWRPSKPVQSSFVEAPPETFEPNVFDLGQPLETAEQPLFEEPSAPADTSFHGGSAAAPHQGMPWEETAAAGANRPASGEATDDDFDDWFAAEPPQEEPGEPQQPAATTPQSIADDTIEGDEEDDDLEMFRSWLQSLKK
jgi:hypothetical protein